MEGYIHRVWRLMHRLCTHAARPSVTPAATLGAAGVGDAGPTSDPVFRGDGSLVDLPSWHRWYRQGDLTHERCMIIEDHLCDHRGDRSHWDALSLEHERQLCEKILGHPVEDVWAEDLMGAAPGTVSEPTGRAFFAHDAKKR